MIGSYMGRFYSDIQAHLGLLLAVCLLLAFSPAIAAPPGILNDSPSSSAKTVDLNQLQAKLSDAQAPRPVTHELHLLTNLYYKALNNTGAQAGNNNSDRLQITGLMGMLTY